MVISVQVADGRYRLQMVIQELNIEDCNVKLDVFNGKGVSGNYLVSWKIYSMSPESFQHISNIFYFFEIE